MHKNTVESKQYFGSRTGKPNSAWYIVRTINRDLHFTRSPLSTVQKNIEETQRSCNLNKKWLPLSLHSSPYWSIHNLLLEKLENLMGFTHRACFISECCIYHSFEDVFLVKKQTKKVKRIRQGEDFMRHIKAYLNIIFFLNSTLCYNILSCPLHHRMTNYQVQYCYINAQIPLQLCTLVNHNHYHSCSKMRSIIAKMSRGWCSVVMLLYRN